MGCEAGIRSGRFAAVSTFLPSRLLSTRRVVAGFSTRQGGDEPEALAADAGFSPEALYMVTQVHGTRVVEIAGDEAVDEVQTIEADALVTAASGVALAIRTADCVPLLLASADGRVVSAAHAGWRGLVDGVVAAAVESVCRLSGTPAATMRAAVGPAIDDCCFEVGDEVAAKIIKAIGDPSIASLGPRGRPHVDLRRATVLALAATGIGSSSIELVGACTRCAASMFHSYRRVGAGKGRQVSFVHLRNDEHVVATRDA